MYSHIPTLFTASPNDAARPFSHDTSAPLRLSQEKPTSFYCKGLQLDDLAAWLAGNGYQPVAPRQNEHSRHKHPSGAICVVYRTGTVVAQGSPTASLIALLTTLCSSAGDGEVR